MKDIIFHLSPTKRESVEKGSLWRKSVDPFFGKIVFWDNRHFVLAILYIEIGIAKRQIMSREFYLTDFAQIGLKICRMMSSIWLNNKNKSHLLRKSTLGPPLNRPSKSTLFSLKTNRGRAISRNEHPDTFCVKSFTSIKNQHFGIWGIHLNWNKISNF